MVIEKDTLGNNLAALIGHDLKGPLIRIQVICNQLMTEDFPFLPQAKDQGSSS